MRTRATLERVFADAASRGEVEFEEPLYGASAGQLLARLRDVPATSASVMLIGHSPGIEELAGSLASGGARLEEMRAKYPTGAVATLAFCGAWSELGRGEAELEAFVKPRELCLNRIQT